MSSPKTVLLIENDVDSRLAMRVLLDYHGYRTIEASGGAEGIDLATRHVPDLIIMDLHMPRMNGREAAAALRQHERTRDIPIVLVTADWAALEAQPEEERLFHSRLRKPLDLRTLGDHIRAILAEP